MSQEDERNIEEILASIRTVMTRDDDTSAATEKPVLDLADLEDSAVEPDEQTPENAAPDEQKSDETAEPGAVTPAPVIPAPLVSASTQNSVQDALAALTAIRNADAPLSEQTLIPQGLLKELLRPAIAEWLDRNLPEIVERMVAEEIHRITTGHNDHNDA